MKSLKRWTRDETAGALLDAMRTARGARRDKRTSAERAAANAAWEAERARERAAHVAMLAEVSR